MFVGSWRQRGPWKLALEPRELRFLSTRQRGADFTVKGFLATIRSHSGARTDYGFGCDSAAQACLIAIRLSGKTQIDWSALRSRSFSSFNSTKRASSALAMTISRQRRYGAFCASRVANSGCGFLARAAM